MTSNAEAGPSTPPRAQTSPISSSDPSHTDLVTPAPVRTDPPNAPPPKALAKQLPLETPASSQTPTTRPDVSEFDPYATPVPIPAPASGTAATPTAHPDEPSFNFSGFLKDLRLKSADPVARFLKSFLSNFAKKLFTISEQIKLIHDFLSFISEKMLLCDPWKSQTPAAFDNAMEAMEKLVMNRLYNYTFTPQLVPTQSITTDDLERDEVFAQRVRLFGWIRERHLDVPAGEASQGFLGFAEQELLKINHYKAPRDKMICILNCCKVIFGLIRHTNGAEAASADTFVPILIFVVLHANPENMLSNIEYINRFRSPQKLQGEAGYYLSSLTGAIAFIETMDASSLSNITQDEFEKNVEKAIQDLPPSPSTMTHRPMQATEISPFAATTPGEEAARPLSFPSLGNTKRFFQRTSSQVTEAVSKPLSAIGKILDGIQHENDEEDVEEEWRAGGVRDRESELRQEAFHQDDRRRATTPESPSRRFSHLNLEDSPSGPGTPHGEVPIPDFSSHQLQSTLEQSQEAYSQTRVANVQTLHQMFPDLDEDIVEAVLEGCGDDLGIAIDRLLEM